MSFVQFSLCSPSLGLCPVEILPRIGDNLIVYMPLGDSRQFPDQYCLEVQVDENYLEYYEEIILDNFKECGIVDCDIVHIVRTLPITLATNINATFNGKLIHTNWRTLNEVRSMIWGDSWK